MMGRKTVPQVQAENRIRSRLTSSFHFCNFAGLRVHLNFTFLKYKTRGTLHLFSFVFYT